ncbi:MAG: isoprenylcysteine carboxylmethyltransferase family protein [Betaproteobacteria bacterium]|nr:isoprenylcysteine carboxylmethyltransferase family protein [Betaproteobacteria bacterium]
MGKFIAALYGAAAYVMFLFVFLYAVGFVANWLVPKSIDSGAPGDLLTSLVINAMLLGVFAVQHSVMARPGFKQWWCNIVPASVERSTYVLLSNLALILMFWCWQPMPGVVWDITSQAGVAVMWSLYAAGWLIALTSTFAINHFDLLGLRQVYLNLKGEKYTYLKFKIIGLYGLVRHPIMLGFLIAFWATPHMSVGHLVFAIATTIYVLIALQLEERDLVTHLGDEYKEYQKKVPMIVPLTKK